MENLLTDFENILLECAKFNNEEITYEALIKWFDENCKIKKYISIEQKLITAESIKYLTVPDSINQKTFNSVLTQGDEYIDYIIAKDMIIVAKYLGIDCISTHRWRSKYDTFIQSGLYDYIITQIGTDYNRFDKLVDDFSGIKFSPLIRLFANTFKDFANSSAVLELKSTLMDSLMKMQENNPELKDALKDFDFGNN